MTLPTEIVNLETVAPHPNLLVFAESGAGKTVFACSDDNVLLLNTEPEGEISGARSQFRGKGIKKWDIRSAADLQKCYDWAATLAEKGEPIPFEWFALDSLTWFQEILMKDIIAKVRETKPNKDPDVPEWPDYLKNQKRLIRIVKEFNALPVKMLYTCLAKQETDPEGNVFYCPAIQGKGYEVAQLVLAQMTSYGYLFVKDKDVMVNGKKTKQRNRFIVWETTGSMQGKDRCGIGPYTTNPTLKGIRAKIKAAEPKETKKTA
jgi:AAA domain